MGNFAKVAALIGLILVIAVTVLLTQQKQIFKSKAGGLEGDTYYCSVKGGPNTSFTKACENGLTRECTTHSLGMGVDDGMEWCQDLCQDCPSTPTENPANPPQDSVSSTPEICEGSLSFGCSAAPYMNIAYNISPFSNSGEYGCSIFIEGYDYPIGVQCGSHTLNQVFFVSATHPVTNGETYNLHLSNGKACNMKVDTKTATINCSTTSSTTTPPTTANTGITSGTTNPASPATGGTTSGGTFKCGDICWQAGWSAPGATACGSPSSGLACDSQVKSNGARVCWGSKCSTTGTTTGTTANASLAAGQHSCDETSGAVMTVAPAPAVRTQTATFSLTNANGSVYRRDDFGGGAANYQQSGFDCQENWGPASGSNVCTIRGNAGTYNWTHYWQNCDWANGTYSNCSPECSKSVQYTVIDPGISVTATATLTPTLTPTATSTLTPTATPTTVAYTTDYRCTDTLFDKNNTSLPWKTYQNSDYSPEPVKFSFTFTQNVVLGSDLTLYCQFKDNLGNLSAVYPKSIKYTGGEPKITSIACGYDPLGTGTLFTILGNNFGNHSDQLDGNVKVTGKETSLLSWTEIGTGESSSSASLNLRYKVISKLKEKLPNGRYQIILTTDDGRTAKGYCTMGTTTIDFTVRVRCGDKVGDVTQKDLDVEIKEKVSGSKTLIKKKIKLGTDGKPVDFAPEVEIGKTYTLSIKGPRTVSRKADFTAEEGTTELDEITLPLGDIYPPTVPDDKINGFDKAEMVRQWSLVNDVTRLGDLNGDSRVNSVDYSCLLVNYNKQGD